MKIEFHKDAISPMYDWLVNVKKNNIYDEKKLDEILSLPDYKIEFERYALKGLPVCTITYKEAKDFFMNFNKKDFDNKRLQIKKPYFMKFYDNLEGNLSNVKMFSSLCKEDEDKICSLLKNGLPESVLKDDMVFNIILIISIGNSMGWPYKNNIDFDVVNLGLIKDRESFVHLIAHEIHHTFFPMLVPDDMKPEEYFLINFAFEGLAVYFNNNAHTKHISSKYENEETFCMDKPTWDFYDSISDELFNKFKKDYYKSQKLSMDEVSKLIRDEYEQFYFTSTTLNKKIMATHYPTYYLGCFFYGVIDKAFGKEVLYKCLMNPSSLLDTYNKAVEKLNLKEFVI